MIVIRHMTPVTLLVKTDPIQGPDLGQNYETDPISAFFSYLLRQLAFDLILIYISVDHPLCHQKQNPKIREGTPNEAGPKNIKKSNKCVHQEQKITGDSS